MSGREMEREAKLSFLTEQLSVERKDNKQLRVEIGLAYSREKASLEALKEFERLLNDAVTEKEKLKAENDMLRLHLSESRHLLKQNQSAGQDEATHQQAICRCSQARKSKSGGEQNGDSFTLSSGSGSNELQAVGNLQDVAQKSWYLEQQIIALTRDKKQLMTHLHWLSRQRAEQCGHDYIPCQLESETRNVSLEEGSRAKLKSLLARFSKSDACSTCEEMCEAVDDSIVENPPDMSQSNSHDEYREQLREKQFTEKQFKGREPKEKQMSERKLTEKQLKEKLEGLKTMLLAVREIAAKNNETCDSIFQLSFQNIKHPNEPRSYRMWSSHDEEHISSLVKSQESMNVLKSSGYRSLQNHPELQNGELNTSSESQVKAKKGDISNSSLQLYDAEESGSNEYSGNPSSFETPSKTCSPLSRSLSDIGNMRRPSPGEHLEHLMMARGNPKPFFSTFTNADLQSTRSNTHNTDFQTVPYQCNSLGRTVRQRATESSEDVGLSFLSATASSTRPYSENLIS